ncbi:MAG: hypothetical protein ACTTI3_07835 [Treponema sp.]
MNDLAQMTGRTQSYYIKEAIEEKLANLELIYLAQSRRCKGKTKLDNFT